MSKVEEAWVDVTATMILEDKRGWSQVEIESAVRAGFLAVLDAASDATFEPGNVGFISLRKEIKKLGEKYNG